MTGNGYSTVGDIHQTADGKDWSSIWSEFQETLKLLNTQRTAVARLFTAKTANSSDFIEQSIGDNEFEEASEFGVPKSVRLSPSLLELGYPFRWFDSRKGWTWRFLAEVESGQLEAIHAAVLEADNRLVFSRVLRALLTKTPKLQRDVNEYNVPVYPLWDGEDDAKPPSYAGKSFAPGHSHYRTTNGAFEGVDLDYLIRNVTEHGYGSDFGSQIVLLAHPDTANVITTFRAGQVAADGGKAANDFIPAANAPAFLSDKVIIGDRAPGSYEGLKVLGSYGEGFIVTSNWVPVGYVVAVASGGQHAPLAFREHKKANLRGLLLIPGDNNAYPLQNSYYTRSFGVGVRHRGAAAVLQVTAGETYTSPTIA
ncbi:hypothetical protein SAMN05444374_11812 [Rhodococcoides kroppenstedtii]|uniref:Phage major capsid protein, HK97 family n=1 Tax=Rhodococcoides kroppenstedtii TaxID=293050 RepID=A0A1I0UBW4_9NOCA|nr:hypothetical protein [Rhodococcus kroppenstedtii]SFA61514.1 hypothetical protein SAMN05444374_11812 [Rhodococcus kroppenstedtii]